MDDQTTPLVKASNTPAPKDYSHLKTYTAGEDGSRLAEMAKEFGLENQRQPRKQVRDDSKPGHRRGGSFYAELLGNTGKKVVEILVNDSSVEVARMRAVYTLGCPTRRAGSFSEYGGGGGPSSAASTAGRRQRDSTMPDWLEQIEHEEEDLHAHGVGGDLTSAVLGIVKGMVGPAILYLPHGLAGSGYGLAFPIMALSTAMFLYSSQCLLDAWRLEHDKMHREIHPTTTNHNSLHHSDTPTIVEEGGAEEEDQELLPTPPEHQQPKYKMTFLSYPELAYRALGENGERIIKVGIAAMQSGVCLTYLIFVPQNFSTALQRLSGIYISPEWFLVVMVAIQVPLSWIRDIRKLTITNFLANALILFGLITCLVLSLKQATTTRPDGTPPSQSDTPLSLVRERVSHLYPFAKDWFLFIGTSVLLFEGSITLLVPLQEAVVKEEDRQKFPSVYRNTILSIICFYIFFSLTCWMSLGNDVRTVLTTSLPVGNAATSVQLAYSIAVIFTFPLQNFPALEITCRSVANAMESVTCCGGSTACSSLLTKRNVISSVLVGLLAIIAVTTMDSLDKVVSLMGGLLGCPIAFIFPPIIHYKLLGEAGLLTPTQKFLDGIVVLLGFVATFIATFTTLMTWN